MPNGTHEITAVRRLLGELDLEGRTVPLEAMHPQTATASLLVEQCGADYGMTAVKDHPETLLDDLQAIHWAAAADAGHTRDKAQGRIESRHCIVVDIGGPEWDRYCDLPHRRQAFRIHRLQAFRITACAPTSRPGRSPRNSPMA